MRIIVVIQSYFELECPSSCTQREYCSVSGDWGKDAVYMNKGRISITVHSRNHDGRESEGGRMVGGLGRDERRCRRHRRHRRPRNRCRSRCLLTDISALHCREYRRRKIHCTANICTRNLESASDRQSLTLRFPSEETCCNCWIDFFEFFKMKWQIRKGILVVVMTSLLSAQLTWAAIMAKWLHCALSRFGLRYLILCADLIGVPTQLISSKNTFDND